MAANARPSRRREPHYRLTLCAPERNGKEYFFAVDPECYNTEEAARKAIPTLARAYPSAREWVLWFVGSDRGMEAPSIENGRVCEVGRGEVL